MVKWGIIIYLHVHVHVHAYVWYPHAFSHMYQSYVYSSYAAGAVAVALMSLPGQSPAAWARQGARQAACRQKIAPSPTLRATCSSEPETCPLCGMQHKQEAEVHG